MFLKFNLYEKVRFSAYLSTRRKRELITNAIVPFNSNIHIIYKKKKKVPHLNVRTIYIPGLTRILACGGFCASGAKIRMNFLATETLPNFLKMGVTVKVTLIEKF